MNVTASIVIPTRNRAETLYACLNSLVNQTIPTEQFEVIVVDNGSNDHTSDVVSEYANALNLSYVYTRVLGLHVGRHEGMRRAKADILIFADDDIEANPNWIRTIVDSFDAPEVALVGGNNHPMFECAPPDWLMRWWQRPVHKGRALGYLSILDFGRGQFEIDPGYIWGCNFSIRRDVLLAAGGFHPDALPSDRLRFRGDGETHVSNYIRKSKHLALFNSDASVRHRVPAARMRPDYIAQRAYAQGISDSYTHARSSGGPESGPSQVARRLTRLRSHLQQRLKGLLPNDEVGRVLWATQLTARSAYHQGYNFHQRELRRDPALLEWVLRKDYL
ncbi:glycosyltransferase family 2 protein [Aerolutibacter daejeonensis]|uniref:glycosyltransferase family 2 protein n=1 Tax=Aerolutibacter daejeonensis TaxID=346181 RepID=UPI0018DC767F|nr:glycosyltransferase family 2 protein [Lysobacter daejeonensis]